MSTDVIMPALGLAQETGKVLSWRHREGETVAKGAPLMEIETDKVTVEIEAPASGVLADVTVGPGDDVPVGQVIAVIKDAGEVAAKLAPDAVAGSPAATPVAARIAAGHGLDLSLVSAAGDRIRKDDVMAHLGTQRIPPGQVMAISRIPASPKARRLAAEQGLDLASVHGTGPEGAVLSADVLAAAVRPDTAAPSSDTRPQSARYAMRPQSQAVLQEAAELVQPTGMGRLMAQRTTQSFRDTPHFYLTRELPAARLIEARARLLPTIEARAGVRLSFTDLLIRILAQALAEHPLLNSSWQDEDGAIKMEPRVNLGVAAATPQGLLVPVIRDAAAKNLTVIGRERSELARRAVAGALTPDDLSGSTATLSNLGMYDIDMFQAIINPPHSMILAVGRIAERPVVRDGAIVAAHTFWVTGSFDHRIHDGARAAEFLRTFAGYVEEPLGLL